MSKYHCNSTVDPNSFDTYEESVAIYFNVRYNVFEDDDGFPIFDIYQIITPNDLYLFHHKKEYMIVKHQSLPNIFVEMYYPIEEDDYE